MFHHLGQSLFEVMWMPNLDDAMIEKTTTFENMEPIMELVRSGKGIVAFTGHAGNWEWMAYCLTKRGIPMSVLQRERNEAQLNQFITRIRATAGIRTIDRGSTAAAAFMVIRAFMRRPGKSASGPPPRARHGLPPRVRRPRAVA